MNIEHTIKAQSEQLSTEVELSDAELATVQGGLCPAALVPGAVAILPSSLVNANVVADVLGVVGLCAHATVLGSGLCG
jgi:hypothetical protein